MYFVRYLNAKTFFEEKNQMKFEVYNSNFMTEKKLTLEIDIINPIFYFFLELGLICLVAVCL